MSDSDSDDIDDPLESDMDHDSDDLAEMICPHCHRAVSEDTQKCPHCGDWIDPVAPGSRGWGKIIYVVMVLLLVAIILWMWH